MRRLLPLLLAAPLLAGFGWPDADPEPVGADGARMLWFGEHVGLLTANLEAVGWTPETTTLQVWSAEGEIAPDVPTLMPPDSWAEVAQVQERELRLDMFANLPDVAYSLSDWAMGNERCSLNELGYGVDEGACNIFTPGWLAGLNSTHFVPQSYYAWSWHHERALEVAARCVELDVAVAGLNYPPGPYGDWLDASVAECETLALALEGIGHHYLQDAWSSGHMWERWGSPSAGYWSDRTIPLLSALSVGGLAGLIHGSESILGEPDPMCTEHPDVLYLPGGGGALEGPAVGDYYVDELVPAQRARLVACGQGSLDAVVAALPGALGLTSTGAPPVTREACFEQRVTNEAWRIGLLEPYGVRNLVISSIIRWMGRLALVSKVFDEPALVGPAAEFRAEMTRLSFVMDAALWSGNYDPLGTDYANLELPMDDGSYEPINFLGAERNRVYAEQLEDDFETFDPPWAVVRGTATASHPKKEQDAEALRRTFHRAAADYWCPRVNADKDEEESDLRVLQDRCQGPDDGTGGREAACTACEELALRHHRDGDDATSYDLAREPLCDALGATSYFYLSTGPEVSRFQGTSAWCRGGGGWSVSDTAVWTFDPSRSAESFGDGATLVADLPTGVSARSLAAGADRAFFAGTDGNLYQVGVFGDVQAFGDVACAGPRGVALDSETGRLFVACHDNHTLASFTTFNSPPTLVDALDLQNGVPGAVVEEPVDVAVHPLGYEVAVASYETYGQRDGVTFVDIEPGGFFGAAVHVDTDANYTINGGQWDLDPGVYFANSAGVDYTGNGFEAVASNFGNLECLGGGFSSCDQPYGVGAYWVSTVDALLRTPEENHIVTGRTTDVLRLWDDLAAVVQLTPAGRLYVFDTSTSNQPVGALDLGGYERPDDLAVDRDGRRIFVGFADDGATCGLGVVEAGDPDPAQWTFDRLDPSVGCARFVDVPE